MQDTQHNIVAYMRTRTEGRANDTLSALIRTLRDSDEPLDYDYLLDRMEKTYGNPHRRVEARAQFRQLRLREPAEFATFQEDFFRLAQEQKLPQDQWVEEFHEKLPPALRTQLARDKRMFIHDYDMYVDLARDIAREHTTLYHAEKKKSKFPSTRHSSPPRPAAPRVLSHNANSGSTLQTSRDSGDVTCYNCNKKGHYSRDCPVPRAEHKLVEREESQESMVEDSSSEEESGEDSA